MPARTIRRLLIIGLITVVAAGVAVEVWHHHAPDGAAGELVPLLSLSYEANLPTWYASSLLLCCALVLAAIAHRARPATGWWGLAIGFGLMSLDEAAELHEQLGGRLDTGGVLYFDWVIPAAAVVAVLALVYLRFLIALPPVTRRRFVVAAAVYLGGALVMELPLGWWTERHGDANLGYALIDAGEEALELAGASLFLDALLAYREAPA